MNKRTGFLLLVLCISLSSCRSENSFQPTIASTPIPSKTTNLSITVVPSPTPIPRWITYQSALAEKIVNTTNALCEFELLGKSTSQKEVYLWALCWVNAPDGASGSVPAVVHLSANGEIEKVEIPRDGVAYPLDVEALFPQEIAERIFNEDFSRYSSPDHLIGRQTIESPPLMIIDGTPLP